MLSQRSYYIDILAKLAIPFVLTGIAWATYMTNSTQASNRMAFDLDAKRTELRQKEDELFLKKNDSERNRDALKSGFIQNNLSLITSQSPESEQQLIALAKAILPSQEVEDVLSKATQIRINLPKHSNISTTSSLPSSYQYKTIGKKYVESGNFKHALLNFETATLLNASDAEAWNYKAYAEMRTDQNNAAFKSISTAINLHPADHKLQEFMMLNAAKILCSMGRIDQAISYIKRSIDYAPNMLGMIRGDVELQRRCNFTKQSPVQAGGFD